MVQDKPDLGLGAIFEGLQLTPQDPRLGGVEAGDDQVLSGLDHALADRGDLLRGLAFAKHHFGNSAAELAMEIDLGKAEVGKGQMAQARNAPAGRSAAPGRPGSESRGYWLRS